MATIEKRGESYRIIVSGGYTAQGKQIRERMTWTPPEGMPADKARKEAERQAVLFEEQIKSGRSVDSRMKLETFIKEKYIPDYVELYLKKSTRSGYKRLCAGIIAALGHMKLCDVRPSHINAFYRNLQEEGMRASQQAVPKIDVAAARKQLGLSKAKLAESCGLTTCVLRAAEAGRPIRRASAEKLAAALGMKLTQAFTISKDMSPLSDRTVLSYHRVLSGIFTKAVQWEYINVNPCRKTDHPTDPGTEAPFLDEDDAKKLLTSIQSADIQWRAPIIFDIFSGLRRAELVGLRWSDVDLESAVIRVRQTYNYAAGYGAYEDTPKSRSSDRPVKLARSAVLLLQEYKTWQDARRELLGDAWENTGDRVFTTDCGRPIYPGTLTKWFTSFARSSGLPRVTIHSLRHTYASLMISDGVPITVIQHQLGHSKASTTTNIYAHLIASAEAKAQESIDSRFLQYAEPQKSASAG